MRESDTPAQAAAEAVARQSYGKLVAYLAARTRDVAAAEDALGEAFAAAMSDWPNTGVPHKPEAWLLTVARRKMIDAIRRWRSGEAAAEHLKLMANELEAAATHECDIIVMAPHGHHGIAGILIGSETQKVLTHSKIPVLVVR